MASGTRGYSSYRGRGRKGKIFLAILLILIILGSVGFIMAREHMRYDADGNLHFDLPWDKGTSDPVEAPGDPDVVIREPERPLSKHRSGDAAGGKAADKEIRRPLRRRFPKPP